MVINTDFTCRIKHKWLNESGLLILLILFLSINVGGACPQEDLSGDCIVGIADLVTFAEQWLDPVG